MMTAVTIHPKNQFETELNTCIIFNYLFSVLKTDLCNFDDRPETFSYNNRCFIASPNPASYDSHLSQCQSLAGNFISRMAVLKKEELQQIVKKELMEVGEEDSVFWIGLTRSQWLWVAGTIHFVHIIIPVHKKLMYSKWN